MNKVIFCILSLLVINISLQAQVIISSESNPTTTNSSVLLEFGGDENKGIILPSVSSISTVNNGTFIFNSTSKAIQVYQSGSWTNLTDLGSSVTHNYNNSSTSDIGNGVIIGNSASDREGILLLESTTKALVLPKVANPVANIPSPIAGTMVYDTSSQSIAVYDGANWYFWK